MTQKITVEGMTCDHCEQSVEEALTELEGVESASADRNSESVTVEGEPDTDAVVQAIDKAGYTAST